MRINLIGSNFDISSGQGVYRYSGELYKSLKHLKQDVCKNIRGDINHVQQPELILKALFLKNIVTTVHDVMPVFNRERKSLFRIIFYFFSFITCIRSKRIIVVSKSTMKDLIKYFPFCKNKIKLTYEGVDSKNLYPLERKTKNKNFTFGYLGGFGKRKNIEFILKLAKEFQENKKIVFKIAGKGPEKERIENMAKEMKLDNVQFEGFVPDDKLNEFYNSLDLFIFPSLYEGFGLPVLEAMSCGIPVAVSNISSLPEIAGDAGILLNIEKIRKSVELLENILDDKRKLKDLSEKSIKRAKYFSWEKCAKETLEVYEDLK